MIFEHRDIQYEVSALTGWQSRMYGAVSLDVLKMLSFHAGVKLDNLERLIVLAPNTIVQSYEYFTKFCLSTKTETGTFADYNIQKLAKVNDHYNHWLDLISQDGFYEKWTEAYLHENRETLTEADKKKEVTGK